MSVALTWAQEITENSPDAVQSSKKGLMVAEEHTGIEEAFKKHINTEESKRVYSGYNIRVRYLSLPLVFAGHS
jgi:hypothetical protein